MCRIYKTYQYGSGYIILKFEEKRVKLEVDASLRNIVICNILPNNELNGSYYSYEFYLRHTIDHLIIEVTNLIFKLLGTEKTYKLWI